MWDDPLDGKGRKPDPEIDQGGEDGEAVIIPFPGKLGLKAEEAAEVLGIGRTGIFARIKSGELDSYLEGKCRIIPWEACVEYVRRKRQEGSRSGRPGGYLAGPQAAGEGPGAAAHPGSTIDPDDYREIG